MNDSTRAVPPLIAAILGRKFGRWTVLSYFGVRISHHYVLCRCDCGTERAVYGYSLRKGHTHGCTKCSGIVHGSARMATRGRLYKAWGAMKQRCLNSSDAQYALYGGRGIKVCARWADSFQAFQSDMGEPPAGKSLDRIDNNAHYSCGMCSECTSNGWLLNCRWATHKEQMRNTRSNRYLDIDGERLIVKDACVRYGISHSALCNRLNKGWSGERLISPPRRRKA